MPYKIQSRRSMPNTDCIVKLSPSLGCWLTVAAVTPSPRASNKEKIFEPIPTHVGARRQAPRLPAMLMVSYVVYVTKGGA